MKKILIATLFVFVMSAFQYAPVSQADHHGGSKCASGCEQKGHKCKVKKLKKKMAMYWAYRDELKLTDEQLGGIADIKHAAMKQMIRESAEAKVVKVDVKTELWQPQINAEKVMPLIDAKYAAKAKVAKTMVQALADAQAILTDDQRKKMLEIKVEKYLKEKGLRGGGCSHAQCPLAGKK